MCPGVDDLIVTFVVGDETHVVVGLDFVYLLLTLGHDTFLLWRHDNVVEVEGKSCLVSHAVTEVLDTIEELAGTSHTDVLDDVGNHATQGLLRDNIVEESYFVGHDAVDDDATYRGLNHVADMLAVNDVIDHYLNRCVKVALALVVGNDGFLRTVEGETSALGTGTQFGNIVETEHHVL